MVQIRYGLLAVRDVATDVTDDEGNVVLSGAPSVPSSWTVTQEAGGWYSIHTDTGTLLHANRINTRSGKGLYLVLSKDRALLDSLASGSDLIAPIVDAWQAVLDGNETALLYMRFWRWFRIDGYTRDPETGDPIAVTNHDAQLIPEGGQLPDPNVTPLPWLLDSMGNLVAQADATIRVDTIHRPAFLRSILGYVDHEDAIATEAS